MVVERPNEKVLDQYYKLADLKSAARCDASIKILKNVESSKDEKHESSLKYCLDRLVKGLASNRLAARVGFAATLTQLIKSFDEEQLNYLLRLVESELPIDKQEGNANVIGRALVLLAIVKGIQDQFVEGVADKISSMTMFLFDKRLFLQPLCVETILILSKKADDAVFQAKIWPCIQSQCQLALTECSANNFALIFGLKKSFPKFLSKKSKVAALVDSNVAVDSNTLNSLTNLFVAASISCPVVHPGVLTFLESVLQNETLLKSVWPKAIEEGFLQHQHRSVISNAFQVLSRIIPTVQTDNQMNVIFSSNLLSIILKSLRDKNTVCRFARVHASQLLDEIAKFASTRSNAAEIVLARVFDISIDFDRIANVKFAERLVLALKDDASERFVDLMVKTVEEKPNSPDASAAFRYLSSIFACNGKRVDIRMKIFDFLTKTVFSTLIVENEQNKEFRGKAAGAFFACLERLCNFVVKRKNEMSIGITKENLQFMEAALICSLVNVESNESTSKVLKKSSKYLKKCLENVDEEKHGNVWHCFALLFAVFGFHTLHKPKEYANILKEILTCYDEFRNNEDSKVDDEENEDTWLDVLIDLMLMILSKNERSLTIPTNVAMFYLSSSLTLKNLQPIFKVLTSTDASTMEVDDEEFEPIGEEDEIESDEDGEEEKSNIDPNFVTDLEKALNGLENTGNGENNGDDKESVSSDLSDEAMLRLDDKLADVFRLHLKKSSKNDSAQLVRDAEAFRSKCFDLLSTFIYSSSNADNLLKLILPLMDVEKKFADSRQQKSVVNRARQALNLISTKKQFTSLSLDEEKSKLFPTIVDVARQVLTSSKSCRDVVLQKDFGDALKFLVKLIQNQLKDEDAKNACWEEVQTLVDECLECFINEPTCLTSVSLFALLFETYPHLFWHLLPKIIEKAFDSEVRLFRRNDMLTLCQCLMCSNGPLKDPTSKKSTKKVLKKFCSTLRTGLTSIFTALAESSSKDTPKEEETSKKKKEDKSIPKPMFTANLTKLLSTVVRLLEEDVAKEMFGHDEQMAACLNGLTSKKAWNNKHRALHVCDRLIMKSCAGKRPYSVMSAIMKKISTKKEEENKEEEIKESEPPAKKKKAKNEIK